MKIKLCLIVLLAILITGCVVQPVPISPPLASTTPELEKALPPTKTSYPTWTPFLEPTQTITLTFTQSPMFTSSPTLNEREIIDKNCISADFVRPNGFLLSIDSKYAAFICWPVGDEIDISITKIVLLDNLTISHEISFRRDYFDIGNSEPLSDEIKTDLKSHLASYYALYPVYWAFDNKILYLAEYSPASGVQFGGVQALVQFNLNDGVLMPILPKPGFYSFRFSDDGSKLLYVDQSQRPMSVIVQEISTMETKSFILENRFTQAGYIKLSPDQTKMVVSAIGDEGVSLILLNLFTMSQEYLVKDIPYDFFPLEWIDNNHLYGWQVIGDQDTTNFYLDIITKDISPAPCPTPEP